MKKSAMPDMVAAMRVSRQMREAKKVASALAPSEPAGSSGSLRCDGMVLFPVGSVQGAIDRLEDAARIANSVGAFLYAEAFMGVANNLRADMARATERQPEENGGGQRRAELARPKSQPQ